MANHTIGIHNGYLFDYLDPDPALIDLETIGVVLGRMPRFGGHTTRLVTVAEHSLRVRRLARWIAMLGANQLESIERVELHALLHDAHEVYTPWGDCLSPGKHDFMHEVEDNLDVAILESIQLEPPCDGTKVVIKHADMLARYYEATLWAPHAPHWAPWLPSRPKTIADAEELLRIVQPCANEDWLAETMLLLSRPGMLRPSGGSSGA